MTSDASLRNAGAGDLADLRGSRAGRGGSGLRARCGDSAGPGDPAVVEGLLARLGQGDVGESAELSGVSTLLNGPPFGPRLARVRVGVPGRCRARYQSIQRHTWWVWLTLAGSRHPIALQLHLRAFPTDTVQTFSSQYSTSTSTSKAAPAGTRPWSTTGRSPNARRNRANPAISLGSSMTPCRRRSSA